MCDIHNYKLTFKREERNVRKAKISRRNKQLILEFGRYCLASGIGYARIQRFYQILRDVCLRMKKDLDSLRKRDIYKLLEMIEERDFTAWTKYTYKSCFRKFCKWMAEAKGKKRYMEFYHIVKPTVKNNNHKLPEELLTEEEVLKMVEVADNPRDKALIMTLYESGCRIGEIGSMKVKHVSFDDYGAVLIVNGKTGMRRVRVINSAPYLSEWLRYLNGDKESPLWVSKGGKFLTYSGITRIIRKWAKEAGIKKRVYPHLFRHSRATHLANYLTEAQMKNYFGWAQSSKMASVYVHLSGRDVDNKIIEIYGLKKKEEMKKELIKIKECPRCFYKNPADAKFCVRCGLPLDVKSAISAEEEDIHSLMKELLKDEEVQRVLIRKMREMRAKAGGLLA